MLSSPAALTETLERADAAYTSGDTTQARLHYRTAIDTAPDCVDAWLGLSRVTPQLDQRRTTLQRALALDPANVEALAALATVEALLAEGKLLAPPSMLRPSPAIIEDAMPSSEATVAPPTVCYRHGDRETALHCVQCERPICGLCARPAAVGQLCPDCVRLRRPVNYQVGVRHLAVTALVVAVLACVASVGALLIGRAALGFYVALFGGPFAAEGIVRVLDRATRAKRGRAIQWTAGVAAVLGMLPVAMGGNALLLWRQLADAPPELLAELQAQGFTLWSLLASGPDAMVLLFALVTAATLMYRLK